MSAVRIRQALSEVGGWGGENFCTIQDQLIAGKSSIFNRKYIITSFCQGPFSSNRHVSLPEGIMIWIC